MSGPAWSGAASLFPVHPTRGSGASTATCDRGEWKTSIWAEVWLLGSRLLIDPEAVIGTDSARKTKPTGPRRTRLREPVRMARKNSASRLDRLADRTRRAPRISGRKRGVVWRKPGVPERERDYLMERRQRDEFEYAWEFGLVWPLILRRHPYPRLCSRLGPDQCI